MELFENCPISKQPPLLPWNNRTRFSFLLRRPLYQSTISLFTFPILPLKIYKVPFHPTYNCTTTPLKYTPQSKVFASLVPIQTEYLPTPLMLHRQNKFRTSVWRLRSGDPTSYWVQRSHSNRCGAWLLEQRKGELSASSSEVQSTISGTIDIVKQQFDVQGQVTFHCRHLHAVFHPKIKNIDTVEPFNWISKPLALLFNGLPPCIPKIFLCKVLCFPRNNWGEVQSRTDRSILMPLVCLAQPALIGPHHNLGWMPRTQPLTENSLFWKHNGLNVDGIQRGDALSQGKILVARVSHSNWQMFSPETNEVSNEKCKIYSTLWLWSYLEH